MSAIAIILILFLILLFTGLPLYVNLGLTSFLYMFLTGTNPMVVVQRITQASNSFTMIAAPFFILMGNLMNTGGVTRKMFRFANVIVGTVPGGMGHANVLCSALFAGMSGTAVADAGGLGNIEIQAMREVGYDDDFSCAVTAASSVLGPIIPPSLPMVIMCVTVGASVGRCFVGGIIPGILIAIALCSKNKISTADPDKHPTPDFAKHCRYSPDTPVPGYILNATPITDSRNNSKVSASDNKPIRA